MDWQLREGVILTEVCDEYLLVGCSIVRGKCPYVLRVNDSAAFIWKEMEKGKTYEEIVEALKEEYEVTEDIDLREVVDEFTEVLKDNGYIVSGENDG